MTGTLDGNLARMPATSSRRLAKDFRCLKGFVDLASSAIVALRCWCEGSKSRTEGYRGVVSTSPEMKR